MQGVLGGCGLRADFDEDNCYGDDHRKTNNCLGHFTALEIDFTDGREGELPCGARFEQGSYVDEAGSAFFGTLVFWMVVGPSILLRKMNLS